MKDLNFYKYFEDDNGQMHFWESENHVLLDRGNEVKEQIQKTIPEAKISFIQQSSMLRYCNIVVKIYSNEDNAVFCLIIGQ